VSADGLFVEETATPLIRSVGLSHLSIELGHLYMNDFQEGEPRLRDQFARVQPWVRTAEAGIAAQLGGRRPRISTCFLIDDYFTRFSSPPEVVSALVSAARANGLAIDYVARESGCASADGVDLARLVLEHVVHEPVEGANGSRPPTVESGWLTNGERSPGGGPAAMSAPRQWQPPRQSAVQNHSIFTDVELWHDGPDGRLWACAFLAAVWQLQRLGLIRDQGRPVAEPVRMAADELPTEWDEMPAVVQLNPAAHAWRAYRTFSALDSRFLPVEFAVRTILTQVSVDAAVAAQAAGRARAEGIELPAEIVARIGYAFV
jgi:hypothetical protein